MVKLYTPAPYSASETTLLTYYQWASELGHSAPAYRIVGRALLSTKSKLINYLTYRDGQNRCGMHFHHGLTHKSIMRFRKMKLEIGTLSNKMGNEEENAEGA